MENVLQEAVQELEQAKKTGKDLPLLEKQGGGDLIPMHVTTEIIPGQKLGTLKFETIVGRGLWLFGIRHTLTKTLDVLHHRWTILAPPKGLTWITSDDPVIRANFYDSDRYDFKGGWGSRGTEIILPLSPHHLLYTQVGERPPRRGEEMTRAAAEVVRRCIAEHANRMIFSAAPDPEIPNLRSRTVDASLLREEGEHWRRWHEKQTAAERDLKQSK